MKQAKQIGSESVYVFSVYYDCVFVGDQIITSRRVWILSTPPHFCACLSEPGYRCTMPYTVVLYGLRRMLIVRFVHISNVYCVKFLFIKNPPDRDNSTQPFLLRKRHSPLNRWAQYTVVWLMRTPDNAQLKSLALKLIKSQQSRRKKNP